MRGRILAETARIITEQGYEAFTIRKLAGRIEYSPRTIYLYFSDKESILAAMVEAGFAHTLRQMEEHPLPGEPAERLKHQLRRHIAAGLAHPEQYRAVIDILNREGFTPGRHQKRIEKMVREEIALLMPGCGEERAAAAADLLFATLRGVTLDLIARRGRLGERGIEQRIDWYIRWAAEGLPLGDKETEEP